MAAVLLHTNTAAFEGGGAVIATDAVALALPPAPVQASEKLLLVVSAAVVSLPAIALLPDQAPDAIQDVALADDQVKVEGEPLATLVGLALIDTVGAGVGVAVNVAVQVEFAVRTIAVLAAVPAQLPDQPVKVEPVAGAALNVIEVFCA